jgi:hypothetical protein
MKFLLPIFARRQVVARVAPLGLAIAFVTSSSLFGQERTWKIETVDKSGAFASIAVDDQLNLHVSYSSTDEGVKYAFRQANSAKWFTSSIGRGSQAYTNIALDHNGNPTICYTSYESLNVVRFAAGTWKSQEVGSGFGPISYTCSLAFAADDTLHISWYQYQDREHGLFLHLKHAVLQDGQWLARTVDFDAETGKWNSLVVDPQGHPHISYSAWRSGQMKYAIWNGSRWHIAVVDSRDRAANVRGEGNPGIATSLLLTSDGTARFSYFDGLNLKFAFPVGDSWKVENIDTLASTLGAGWTTSRSTLLRDGEGNFHIVYGDYLSLKHAYRQNDRWRIEYIDRGGPGLYQYASATIDKEGTLYVCYEDPSDASLKVAVGKRTSAPTSQAASHQP